ncbi:MAG: Ig-like domain-containing protein [Gemmatimonadaceae bacterium]|nr:Ig-like domain-containing protein [Gemmatimonadaceae bacterium]
MLGPLPVARRRALALLLFVGSACGGGSESTAPPSGSTPRPTPTPEQPTGQVLTSANLALSAHTMEVGDLAKAQPEGMDQRGNFIPAVRFSFASSAPSIVTVDTAGVLTARAPGDAQIQASALGVTSPWRSVTVIPVAVTRVEVSPQRLALQPGQQGVLSAAALNRALRPIEGRAITWSSSDSTIARVSSTGAVSALRNGVATISATSEGRTGAAAVVVAIPDPAGPTKIAFATPLADQPIKDTLKVKVGVNGPRAISRVEARLRDRMITLDSTPVGLFGAVTAWVGTFDLFLLGSGYHYLVVTATDALGVATVDSIRFERAATLNGGDNPPQRRDRLRLPPPSRKISHE